MIAPLIADGGEMTVLHQLATYTWGTWSVTWPEGIDPPELPDEREFGFVSKLSEPTGRFARRFDRADVSIDVENEFSDVEFVLDEAAGRMAGDAFFERDITNAGLGRQVPLVDFGIGDVVPVLIWGKVIDLPVTSIERVSEVGNAVGWRVHVGGQLLGDSVGLDQGNREIYRQIAQERRERIGDVAAVDQKAEVAKGTAEEAKGTADDALAAATDADGVIQGYITEGRQHVVDALGHADDARVNAGTAFSEAERAVGLVADASLIIDQAQEKLDAIPAIIESGRRWARLSAAQSASSQMFASQALIHADKADEHAQSALRLVDDALVLVDAADAALDLIEVELGKIPGIIAEGEQHVENAKGHADRADEAVTDAGAAKAAAETALTNATNLLADIDGEGTDFPTAVTQVLGAHNEVLTKHGEVLDAHDEAIIAASDASREAGAAAQSALDAAEELGLIQLEMIEVDRLQNRAIRAAAGAAAQASMAAMQAAETGRLAARAADEAGKAAGSAGKAAKDALDAAEDLAKAQADALEVQRLHGEAIVAVAGAASYAAGAAVDAAETGESAALAAGKALDAIGAMEAALTAKEAAETARTDTQNIALQDQNSRITFQEESLKKISDMQKRLSRATTRMLEVHHSDVAATDDCWRITIALGNGVAQFIPVASAPTWSGKCVAEIRVWKPGSGSSVTNESRIVRRRWNGSPGSATQTYQVEDGYQIESVMLLYNYSEGEFKTSGNSGGPVTIGEESLYTFGTFTAPTAGNYTVSTSTLWTNVRGGSTHECSIARGGFPVIGDSQKFHQNRGNVRIAPVPRTLSLAADEEISFMAWTNAPFTTYRSIQWEWSVTWLEPASI